MRTFISMIIAYVGTRIIFSLFDFHYDILGEPFDLGKLLIEMGGFAALFIPTYFVLGKIMPDTKKNGPSSSGT